MKFEQCQLNDVLAGVIDYRGKTPTKTESGIRLVTAKVIKKGRVINDGPQEYIHPKTYDEVMRRGVPERNDIFITTEAPLGELALWDSDEQIALAQRVILLRPDPKKHRHPISLLSPSINWIPSTAACKRDGYDCTWY